MGRKTKVWHGPWTLKPMHAQRGHTHECKDCIVEISYWHERRLAITRPKVCDHHKAAEKMTKVNMIWPALHDNWERAF